MTPGAVLHVYIPATHGRVHFILPPTEDIRNSKGKGVQEEAISMGVVLYSLMSFFLETLKQELLFLLMILHH